MKSMGFGVVQSVVRLG